MKKTLLLLLLSHILFATEISYKLDNQAYKKAHKVYLLPATNSKTQTKVQCQKCKEH